jgi:tRNA(Arg) A34 adenosine deaminase TadA
VSRPHHITAVIYDSRGRVLSVGQNSFIKTHPVQAAHARKVGQAEKIFLHAEVHAIVRCKDISKAHRILISRWSENGEPMLAAPCAICLSAIAETGIKVIQHT